MSASGGTFQKPCQCELGQSRRFCDVSFSVRYLQYRTLSRPIGTGLPGSFLRPNCLRPAQPRQLRRSVLDRLRDMSCICGRQRPGISPAPNPRGTCSRSACPGFCPMAVWRRIAQDRRGADHRPLDSRIKGRKVRRGRSSDSAEAYRNFSGIAAHCENPGSPLRSAGQCKVLMS
jgi:hypothetical protein